MTIAEDIRPATRARRAEAGITINLRASLQTRELIDSAAAAEGKSRTEFMIETACRHARDVLLDQRLFILEPDKFAELMRMLDGPAPAPNAALKRLMRSKAPWQE